METTYADRNHRPIAETVAEFYAAVDDAFRRGGNVVIPTFGLERAQDLLYYTFNVQRHLNSAQTHRTLCAAAMTTWRNAVAEA